ncbi:MAG: putative ABC transporter permease [Treponema sp.]|nr:putative ABC transporter permease [Treponema sp.]
MFCGMTFYQICCYFLVYSLIGWIVEVAYHAVTLGKVVNRGFLNGPLCPVYGFGMLAVLAITWFIPKNDAGQTNTILLFLAGMIFTTMIELIAGWILDKAFHARWWDYSDVPMNLNGYICVKFSIIWGLAVLFAVKFFHPIIEHFIAHFSDGTIHQKLGWTILAVSYAILFADVGITVAIVQGFNKELKKLDDLQKALRKPSDKMSEYIAEGTMKVTTSFEEAKVQAALGKAELKDSIKERKEQKLAELFTYKRWGTRRLLRAFPKMKHTKYAETLQEMKNYLQTQLKKRSNKPE